MEMFTLFQLNTFCLIVSTCWGFTSYELFKGFDAVSSGSDLKEHLFTNSTDNSVSNDSTINNNTGTHSTIIDEIKESTGASTSNNTNTLEYLEYSKTNLIQKEEILNNSVENLTTEFSELKCPEEENPINIGPYEVPTQRDFVMLFRNAITEMFYSYHKMVLNFLNDVKEATKATVDREHRCTAKEIIPYRQCVRRVSNQYEHLTKLQVQSLEKQRHKIKMLIKGQVCNMSAIKESPLQLLKALSVEKITLNFALPGFLRMLNSCSRVCTLKMYHPSVLNGRLPLFLQNSKLPTNLNT